MTQKTKRHGRPLSPKSALFKKEVADIKPLLPSHFTEIAIRMFPNLDAESLRYAVVGRKVYWEGMQALRILAGKEPMPEGMILTVPPTQSFAS